MDPVVITGMGLTCPTGPDVATAWANIVAGRSGIATITQFDPTPLSVRFAGEVRHPSASWLPAKDQKKMDRFALHFLEAAAQALVHARLIGSPIAPLVTECDPERIGMISSSAIGGLSALIDNHTLHIANKKVSPHFIPASLINIAAGMGSMLWGIRGPNFGVASACASSIHAMVLGARLIEAGDADIMVVGGSEASITPLSLTGHATMRALSMKNDRPQEASRPWDEERDGFVMGEGGAVLVIERQSHAAARGVPIIATLAGLGMSADGHHLTSPLPGGEGALRAMQQALRAASMSPADIDHINAHATSTPAGDRAEASAIQRAWGKHLDDVHVCATKSMTGHLLGAAGALEVIWTALSLRDGVVPPTLNLDCPSSDCHLPVPKQALHRPLRAALSNSFGFGGTNVSMVLTAP